MNQKWTPFIMAGVVAIVTFINVHFPSLNHLLSYPNTTPSLITERGIFHAYTSPGTSANPNLIQISRFVKNLLPQIPSINYLAEDERKTNPKLPPSKSPKPKTKNSKVDDFKKEIYTDLYGEEDLRYGWNYDTKAPATTEEWNDPNAKIAGTYVSNGKRYTIAVGATQKAANDNAEELGEKLTTLSNDDILSAIRYQPGYTPCPANDTACVQQQISNYLTNTLSNNVTANTTLTPQFLEQVINNQIANQKLLEKIQEFLDPLVNPLSHSAQEQGQTLEDYLRGLGIDPQSEYGKNLLSQRAETITNYRSDLEMIKLYSDPTISDQELAKIECDGHLACLQEFRRDEYLSRLHYPAFAQRAKDLYQINLTNFLPSMMDPAQFHTLPRATQERLTQLNTDLQKAIQVYYQENKSRMKGALDADVYEEIYNKLITDPQSLSAYVKKFDSDPDQFKQYDWISGVGTVPAFDLRTNVEINSIIADQINKIILRSPIEGLYDGNKLVPYSQANSEIKDTVRNQTCSNYSEATYALCMERDRILGSLTMGMPSDVEQKMRTDLSQIESKLDKLVDPALAQQIMQEKLNFYKGAGLKLSIYHSNLATMDNPLIDQELKDQAIDYAFNKSLSPNAGIRGRAANPSTSLSSEQTRLANEYLDRQLVTETYKIGGGAVASVGTSLIGIGLTTILSPFCGPGAPACFLGGLALTGAAGWGATQVPLREMTATEYQQQRSTQFGGITQNNEFWGGVLQGLYSNQGAWGDEGAGRSITTRDNSFALYQALGQQLPEYSALTQIEQNVTLRNNLAIQGVALNQSEVFQNRQKQWTYASLPIAMATSVLFGGSGASAANNISATSLSSYVRGRLAIDLTQQAVGSALNYTQARAQFDTTSGDASLLSTNTQIAYQSCVMSKGSDQCQEELNNMNDETTLSRSNAMKQAFVSDIILSTAQTAASYIGVRNQYFGLIKTAEGIGIDPYAPTIKTVGDLQNAVSARQLELASAPHPADIAALDANTAKIIAEQNQQLPDENTRTSYQAHLTQVQKDNIQVVPVEINGKNTYRLAEAPDTAAPATKQAVQSLNNLLTRFEQATNFSLSQTQAEIALTPAGVDLAVKGMTPGGGKTAVTTIIELAKSKRALYSGANANDALEALNNVLRDPTLRAFAGENLGELYYVQDDGVIYRVSDTIDSFDPKTATPITRDQLTSRLSDPTSNVSIFGTHNGYGWETQKGGWAKDLVDGKFGKIYVLADEGAKDALQHLSITDGEVKYVSQVEGGKDALNKYKSVKGIKSLSELIQTTLAKIKAGESIPLLKPDGGSNYTPQDPAVHNQILTALVEQALATNTKRENSLWNKLTLRATSADPAIKTELNNILTQLKNANSPESYQAVDGQLHALLTRVNTSADPLLLDLDSRYSLLSDIYNQLAKNKNDFGLSSTNEQHLALFEAKAETTKTLSLIGQQIAMYDLGVEMLKIWGIDTGKIVSADKAPVNTNSSSSSLYAWYQRVVRAGGQVAYLDGTPDALVHLGLGGMQGEKVALPKDKIRSVYSYQNESDFANLYNTRTILRDRQKMHVLVLADQRLDFDTTTSNLRSSNSSKEILIAQYRQGSDEFVIIKPDGTKQNLTKDQWVARYHEIASSDNPENGLVIIQGRDRALDISTGVDRLNIRFTDVGPRENVATTSILDSTTQSVFRDRVLTDRAYNKIVSELGDPAKVADLNDALQFDLFFHESLGIKDVADVMPILTARHAEHLNTLRLDATLGELGEMQKRAIEILARHAGDLKLDSEDSNFIKFIQAHSQEGERIAEIYRHEVSSRPLTTPDEIAAEIFARGKLEDARLRSLLDQAKTKLKLNDTQVVTLSKEWGIDTPYLDNINDLNNILSQGVDHITPRDFSTPMYGPRDEVLYWAKNNTTNQASAPEFQVPKQAWIKKTAPSTTSTVTATPITPTFNNQPIRDVLSSNFQTLTFTVGARTIAIINRTNMGGYFYQDGDDPSKEVNSLDELLLMLPQASDVILTTLDGLPIPYSAPTSPADLSAKVSTKEEASGVGDAVNPSNPATNLGQQLAEAIKPLLPALTDANPPKPPQLKIRTIIPSPTITIEDTSEDILPEILQLPLNKKLNIVIQHAGSTTGTTNLEPTQIDTQLNTSVKEHLLALSPKGGTLTIAYYNQASVLQRKVFTVPPSTPVTKAVMAGQKLAQTIKPNIRLNIGVGPAKTTIVESPDHDSSLAWNQEIPIYLGGLAIQRQANGNYYVVDHQTIDEINSRLVIGADRMLPNVPAYIKDNDVFSIEINNKITESYQVISTKDGLTILNLQTGYSLHFSEQGDGGMTISPSPLVDYIKSHPDLKNKIYKVQIINNQYQIKLLGDTNFIQIPTSSSIDDATIQFGRGGNLNLPGQTTDWSRNHFQLNRTDLGYLLINNSNSGTLLNNTTVDGPTLIRDGDIITAGTQTFFVHLDTKNSALKLYNSFYNYTFSIDSLGETSLQFHNPPWYGSILNPGSKYLKDKININEDRLRYYQNPNPATHKTLGHGLSIQADGAGGSGGLGSLASQLIVDRAGEIFYNLTTQDVKERLKETVIILNKEIWALKQELPKSFANTSEQSRLMGSTIELHLIVDNNLYYAHVGDSATILVRNNVAYTITTDQSPIGEELEQKEISEFEAGVARNNNVSTYLNGEDWTANQVEVNSFALQGKDIIIQTSDSLIDNFRRASDQALALPYQHLGVPNPVPGGLLVNIASNNKTPQQIAEDLYTATKRISDINKTKLDNFSVSIIKYDDYLNSSISQSNTANQQQSISINSNFVNNNSSVTIFKKDNTTIRLSNPTGSIRTLNYTTISLFFGRLTLKESWTRYSSNKTATTLRIGEYLEVGGESFQFTGFDDLGNVIFNKKSPPPSSSPLGIVSPAFRAGDQLATDFKSLFSPLPTPIQTYLKNMNAAPAYKDNPILANDVKDIEVLSSGAVRFTIGETRFQVDVNGNPLAGSVQVNPTPIIVPTHEIDRDTSIRLGVMEKYITPYLKEGGVLLDFGTYYGKLGRALASTNNVQLLQADISDQRIVKENNFIQFTDKEPPTFDPALYGKMDTILLVDVIHHVIYNNLDPIASKVELIRSLLPLLAKDAKIVIISDHPSITLSTSGALEVLDQVMTVISQDPTMKDKVVFINTKNPPLTEAAKKAIASIKLGSDSSTSTTQPSLPHKLSWSNGNTELNIEITSEIPSQDALIALLNQTIQQYPKTSITITLPDNFNISSQTPFTISQKISGLQQNIWYYDTTTAPSNKEDGLTAKTGALGFTKLAFDLGQATAERVKEILKIEPPTPTTTEPTPTPFAPWPSDFITARPDGEDGFITLYRGVKSNPDETGLQSAARWRGNSNLAEVEADTLALQSSVSYDFDTSLYQHARSNKVTIDDNGDPWLPLTTSLEEARVYADDEGYVLEIRVPADRVVNVNRTFANDEVLANEKLKSVSQDQEMALFGAIFPSWIQKVTPAKDIPVNKTTAPVDRTLSLENLRLEHAFLTQILTFDLLGRLHQLPITTNALTDVFTEFDTLVKNHRDIILDQETADLVRKFIHSYYAYVAEQNEANTDALKRAHDSLSSQITRLNGQISTKEEEIETANKAKASLESDIYQTFTKLKTVVSNTVNDFKPINDQPIKEHGELDQILSRVNDDWLKSSDTTVMLSVASKLDTVQQQALLRPGKVAATQIYQEDIIDQIVDFNKTHSQLITELRELIENLKKTEDAEDEQVSAQARRDSLQPTVSDVTRFINTDATQPTSPAIAESQGGLTFDYNPPITPFGSPLGIVSPAFHLGEIVAESLRSLLNIPSSTNDYLPGCSDCAKQIPLFLSPAVDIIASQQSKEKKITKLEELIEQNNKHKYDDANLGSSVNSILTTLLASVNDKPISYQTALDAISAAIKATEKASFETNDRTTGKTTIEISKKIADLNIFLVAAIQKTFDTFPIQNTPYGDQNGFNTHVSALQELQQAILSSEEINYKLNPEFQISADIAKEQPGDPTSIQVNKIVPINNVRYTITRSIAKGGNGETFEASNEDDNKVAIKTFAQKGTLSSTDTNLRGGSSITPFELFMNEYKYLQYIAERTKDSPYRDNFVKPLRLITNRKDEVVGYALEFLEGQTLKELQDKGGVLTQNQLDQLHSLLTYLDLEQISWHDISLANIFIRTDGTITLIDPIPTQSVQKLRGRGFSHTYNKGQPNEIIIEIYANDTNSKTLSRLISLGIIKTPVSTSTLQYESEKKRILQIKSPGVNTAKQSKLTDLKAIARKIFDIENSNPTSEKVTTAYNRLLPILQTDSQLIAIIDDARDILLDKTSFIQSNNYQVVNISSLPGINLLYPILKNQVTVGRSQQDSTLPIPNAPDNMSKKHFAFDEDSFGFFIEDLGSMGGTFINRKKITQGLKYHLQAGDIITAGDVNFTIKKTQPNLIFSSSYQSNLIAIKHIEGTVIQEGDKSQRQPLSPDQNLSPVKLTLANSDHPYQDLVWSSVLAKPGKVGSEDSAISSLLHNSNSGVYYITLSTADGVSRATNSDAGSAETNFIIHDQEIGHAAIFAQENSSEDYLSRVQALTKSIQYALFDKKQELNGTVNTTLNSIIIKQSTDGSNWPFSTLTTGDGGIFVIRKNKLYLITNTTNDEEESLLPIAYQNINTLPNVRNLNNQSIQAWKKDVVSVPVQFNGDIKKEPVPYVTTGNLLPGDIVFTTSDGILGDVQPATLIKTINKYVTLNKKDSSTNIANGVLADLSNIQNITPGDDWSLSVFAVPESDCSYCPFEADAIRKANQATTTKSIDQALHAHNDHNFERADAQAIWNGALFARRAQITNQRLDYRRAIKYLTQAHDLLSKSEFRQQITPGSNESLFTQKEVDQYLATIQQLLLTLPFTDSVYANYIDGYIAQINNAIAELESKYQNADNSLTEIVRRTMINEPVLTITRAIGDITGQGEDQQLTQLAPPSRPVHLAESADILASHGNVREDHGLILTGRVPTGGIADGTTKVGKYGTLAKEASQKVAQHANEVLTQRLQELVDQGWQPLAIYTELENYSHHLRGEVKADPQYHVEFARQTFPGDTTFIASAISPKGELITFRFGDTEQRIIRGGVLYHATALESFQYPSPNTLIIPGAEYLTPTTTIGKTIQAIGNTPTTLNNLGTNQTPLLTVHQLQPGDIVLLSSDFTSSHTELGQAVITDEEIRTIVESNRDTPEAIGSAIINQTKEKWTNREKPTEQQVSSGQYSSPSQDSMPDDATVITLTYNSLTLPLKQGEIVIDLTQPVTYNGNNVNLINVKNLIDLILAISKANGTSGQTMFGNKETLSYFTPGNDKPQTTPVGISELVSMISLSRPSAFPALPALAAGVGGPSLAQYLIHDTFQFVTSSWPGGLLLFTQPESRTTINNIILYTKTWIQANFPSFTRRSEGEGWSQPTQPEAPFSWQDRILSSLSQRVSFGATLFNIPTMVTRNPQTPPKPQPPSFTAQLPLELKNTYDHFQFLEYIAQVPQNWWRETVNDFTYATTNALLKVSLTLSGLTSEVQNGFSVLVYKSGLAGILGLRGEYGFELDIDYKNSPSSDPFSQMTITLKAQIDSALALAETIQNEQLIATQETTNGKTTYTLGKLKDTSYLNRTIRFPFQVKNDTNNLEWYFVDIPLSVLKNLKNPNLASLAVILTTHPDKKTLSLQEIRTLFNLPEFQSAKHADSWFDGTEKTIPPLGVISFAHQKLDYFGQFNDTNPDNPANNYDHRLTFRSVAHFSTANKSGQLIYDLVNITNRHSHILMGKPASIFATNIGKSLLDAGLKIKGLAPHRLTLRVIPRPQESSATPNSKKPNYLDEAFPLDNPQTRGVNGLTRLTDTTSVTLKMRLSEAFQPLIQNMRARYGELMGEKPANILFYLLAGGEALGQKGSPRTLYFPMSEGANMIKNGLAIGKSGSLLSQMIHGDSPIDLKQLIKELSTLSRSINLQSSATETTPDYLLLHVHKNQEGIRKAAESTTEDIADVTITNGILSSLGPTLGVTPNTLIFDTATSGDNTLGFAGIDDIWTLKNVADPSVWAETILTLYANNLFFSKSLGSNMLSDFTDGVTYNSQDNSHQQVLAILKGQEKFNSQDLEKIIKNARVKPSQAIFLKVLNSQDPTAAYHQLQSTAYLNPEEHRALELINRLLTNSAYNLAKASPQLTDLLKEIYLTKNEAIYLSFVESLYTIVLRLSNAPINSNANTTIDTNNYLKLIDDRKEIRVMQAQNNQALSELVKLGTPYLYHSILLPFDPTTLINWTKTQVQSLLRK